MTRYSDLQFDTFLERRIELNLPSLSSGQPLFGNDGIGIMGGSGSMSINQANAGEMIDDKALSFDKLSIDKLYINQNLQSSNFVSGSAGWRLQGSVDVEFNVGTF